MSLLDRVLGGVLKKLLLILFVEVQQINYKNTFSGNSIFK